MPDRLIKRLWLESMPLPKVLKRNRASSIVVTDEGEIPVTEAPLAVRKQHALFSRVKTRSDTFLFKVGKWWQQPRSNNASPTRPSPSFQSSTSFESEEDQSQGPIVLYCDQGTQTRDPDQTRDQEIESSPPLLTEILYPSIEFDEPLLGSSPPFAAAACPTIKFEDSLASPPPVSQLHRVKPEPVTPDRHFIQELKHADSPLARASPTSELHRVKPEAVTPEHQFDQEKPEEYPLASLPVSQLHRVKPEPVTPERRHFDQELQQEDSSLAPAAPAPELHRVKPGAVTPDRQSNEAGHHALGYSDQRSTGSRHPPPVFSPLIPLKAADSEHLTTARQLDQGTKLEESSSVPLPEVEYCRIKTEVPAPGSSPATSSLGGPPSIIVNFDPTGQNVIGYTDLLPPGSRLVPPVFYPSIPLQAARAEHLTTASQLKESTKHEESSSAPLAAEVERPRIKTEKFSPGHCPDTSSLGGPPSVIANFGPLAAEVQSPRIKTENFSPGHCPDTSLGGPPSVIANFDKSPQPTTGNTGPNSPTDWLMPPVMRLPASPTAVYQETSSSSPLARKRKSDNDGTALRVSKRGKASPPDVDFFRHLQDPPKTVQPTYGSREHEHTPGLANKRKRDDQEDGSSPEPPTKRGRRLESGKRKRGNGEEDSGPDTPTKRGRHTARADSPEYCPSTSSDDEEVTISKREQDNLLYILTREKALRLTEAYKVPSKFDMGGEERNLYLSLALRGCKPFMAEHWRKDFTTLPESLFALEEGESQEQAKEPFVKALCSSDFSAIRAFKDLLKVGANSRDCQYQAVEPQVGTQKSIERYLRWAVADATLYSLPETIPVHAIQVQRPGQTTLECLTQLTTKLESIAKRFHKALAKSSDPWWPTLVGFALCGPVMTLVSLDTDVGSSAWTGEEGTPAKIIGHFDLAERDEDVWNTLAIAIAVIHTRDSMARLARVGGSHVPSLRFAGERCDDVDA